MWQTVMYAIIGRLTERHSNRTEKAKEEMTTEEVRQKIRENVRIQALRPESKGGQNVGLTKIKHELRSDDLDLTITFGYHRSGTLNKELLQTIFELVLDEIIK